MKEELKQELIKEAINKLDNPWKNLTVKDVSKDLKMGENLTNELFKRADFPSINIGKTKTITAIAYALWKLEKRLPEYKKNKRGINMINNCKEIRVPIEIMNVRNLTITQKVLLSQIAGLDNKEGCFATNSYFAELFNLSKTQISSLISDLKEKGWINIKYLYKENTKCIEKRIIKVNCPPYPIILKEGIKANNNIPIKTEFKDNNKYINNKNKNKYSYTNYEQRDYSNFDWNSLYAN